MSGARPDLVTGASGFAGRHLVRELAGLGREVVALVGPQARGGAVPGASLSLPLDLTRPGELEALLTRHRPARVFHLAAVASPRACAADPARALAVNAEGTRRLLGAVPPDARVLVVSTAAVYAPGDAPLEEDAPLDPRGPYARSKREAELVALAAAERGLCAVVVRPFNHSGPGQSADYALPAFARRLVRHRLEGGPIPVGDLSVVRDFLHVADAVRAYRVVLDGARAGDVVNVASGRGVVLRDLFVGLAERLLGPGGGERALQRAQASPELLAAPGPAVLVGSPKRLETFAFEPSLGLEDLLDGVAGDAAEPR